MSQKKIDQALAVSPVKLSIDSVLDQGESAWKPYLDSVKAKRRPVTPGIFTPPPSPPGRPGPSTRPSWIGPKPPERPSSPETARMKHSVTIEYSSPALRPPVFIFTNLSDPPWEAVEMDQEKTAATGEWRFHKSFHVESGEYQYKFRLGPGDWWVTDESRAVVDDGHGNKNNLLVVKEEETQSVESTPQQLHLEPRHNEAASSIDLPSKKDLNPGPEPPAVISPKAQDPTVTSGTNNQRVESTAPQSSPRDQHEGVTQQIDLPNKEERMKGAASPAGIPSNAPDAAFTPNTSFGIHDAAVDAHIATPIKPASMEILPPVIATQQAPISPAPAPLMEHELFADREQLQAPLDTVKNMATQGTGHDTPALPTLDDSPRFPHEKEVGTTLVQSSAVQDDMSLDDEDSQDKDDGEDHEDQSPLLRHESLSATSAEQEHSPLLRHESASTETHQSSSKAPVVPGPDAEDSIPAEADPDDFSLEQFPTSRQGIYDRIRHTSLQMPEDETVDDSQITDDMVDTSAGVEEAERNDAGLEMLHKIEEEEAERENEEEGDPLLPEIALTGMNNGKEISNLPMTQEDVIDFIQEEVNQMLPEDDLARGGQEGRHKIVAELIQNRGPLGTIMDVLRHPMCWFATVGLVLGVMVGWYKMRYA